MLLLLFLFWIVLSGKITLEIAVFGVILTLVVWLFSCRAIGWSLRSELVFYRLIPHAVSYAAVLIFEIIKSAVSVLPYVFGRAPDGVTAEFDSPLSTPAANAALANSITLTPGTITVCVKDGHFTVHCLSPAFAEGLDTSVFVRRLKKMETAAGSVGKSKKNKKEGGRKK